MKTFTVSTGGLVFMIQGQTHKEAGIQALGGEKKGTGQITEIAEVSDGTVLSTRFFSTQQLLKSWQILP